MLERKVSLLAILLLVATMLISTSPVQAQSQFWERIIGWVYMDGAPRAGLTVHVYRTTTNNGAPGPVPVLEGYDVTPRTSNPGEHYGDPAWLGTSVTDADGCFHIAWLYGSGNTYRVEVETEVGILSQEVIVYFCFVEVYFDYCLRYEGLTPGWWKNHREYWVGYTTLQTVEEMFDVPDEYGLDSDTLLQALQYRGGAGTAGAARILLRAAVAAVLNAAHPDVDYPWTVTAIINAVNNALASLDRDTMITLAGQLDTFNKLGAS